MPDTGPVTTAHARRRTADGARDLHADAAAVLTGWTPTGPAAAGRGTAPWPAGRRAGGDEPGATGPGTSPRARWCSTPPAAGCCSACTASSASGCSSAGTASPATGPSPGAALREATEESGIAGLRDRPGADRRRHPPGALPGRLAALRRPVRGARPARARSSGSATSRRRWAGSRRTGCRSRWPTGPPNSSALAPWPPRRRLTAPLTRAARRATRAPRPRLRPGPPRPAP